MQMVMQLAARLFRLGYAEIWNMCTLNAARSLDLAQDRGSLEPGKRADVLVLSRELEVERVFLAGEELSLEPERLR